MPGFLYFLPGGMVSQWRDQLQSRWGLGYLHDPQQQLIGRQCVVGGNQGMVIGSSANWTAEQVKAGDHVQWRQFPQSQSQPPSLGIVGGDLPACEDLARSEQVSGERLLLADGGQWIIPRARVIADSRSYCNLPMSYGLDDSGDWIANQVLPQYRQLWKHANAYLDAMMEAVESARAHGIANVEFAIPDGKEMVVDALQANYRVGAMEISALGLMVDGLPGKVAEVLIDSQGYEALKKNVEADTGPG